MSYANKPRGVSVKKPPVQRFPIRPGRGKLSPLPPPGNSMEDSHLRSFALYTDSLSNALWETPLRVVRINGGTARESSQNDELQIA